MRDISKLDKLKRIKVINQIAHVIKQLEKMQDSLFLDMLQDHQSNITTVDEIVDIVNQLK